MRTLTSLMVYICFFTLGVYADSVFIPNSKLHLQKQYQISKSDIYSTDIFPHIDKKFKIATLAPDKFTLRFKSVDIKLIFIRYGYEIVSFENDYVEFHFVSDMREREAIDFIKQMYIKHYGKNLHIYELLVRPLGSIPQDYEVIEYKLADTAFKKNTGILSVKYLTAQSTQIKKHTFIYMIKGELDVIKSKQNISINEILSAENTYLERITFERVNPKYITANELNKSSAKSYIRAYSAITKDKIKSRVIIKKGDRIRVLGYENGINMEIVLEARQNGVMNEIINAQNPSSGKILRVRVTDEGKGEIL